ncbi:hypothetical protein HN911_00275 [Candidatus Bathyarchaeota archaeon]|nr:hypothetical protein [Candidatus Bathyarchaeota archaeon]
MDLAYGVQEIIVLVLLTLFFAYLVLRKVSEEENYYFCIPGFHPDIVRYRRLLKEKQKELWSEDNN